MKFVNSALSNSAAVRWQHRSSARAGFWLAVALSVSGCNPFDASEKEAQAKAKPQSLKLAAEGKASCQNPLIDDVEGDGTGIPNIDGRGGFWYTFADTAGSTVIPKDPYEHANGGATNSKHAAHIAGKLANGQVAYAGIGFHLTKSQMPYDLSQASGLCFSAKGRGAARMTLSDVNTVPEGGVCKNCYNSFGKNFELSSDWQKYCFKFDQLAQSPSWGDQMKAFAVNAAFGISWQAVERGADYELWVDDIKLSCE